MSFDPNADPEGIAARAAELALEQSERLRSFIRRNPDRNPIEFYLNDNFEASISNQIANLMSAYAVLKGYVTLEEASR
jgi:hypothetical protein